MESANVRIAVIVGSVRKGRFGPTVADWFVDHARNRPGVTIDKIDLAEFPIEQSLESTPVLEQFGARLALADAFVIVTPEYNHSFPGHLKTAIDAVGDEWKAKPVGFVAYGGMSGGLRAVEQLRVVFAEVHAPTIRETVSFHGARSQFDDVGRPVDPTSVNAAAEKMLGQLIWWAEAAKAQGDAGCLPGIAARFSPYLCPETVSAGQSL